MKTETTTYFLMGIGVGAALGLLCAPKSGAESRSLLADKAKEGTDYMMRSANEGAEYVKRQAADVKATTMETIDRAKAAVKTPIDVVAQAVDAGKQAYSDALNKVATPIKA